MSRAHNGSRIRIHQDAVLSALMEDSDGDRDEVFLPGSEDDSYHLSSQSESNSGEKAETICSGDESSSFIKMAQQNGKRSS